MNYLVVGKAKTGTTVVAKAIHNALPAARFVMEPPSPSALRSALREGGDNVCKIIFEHWDREDLAKLLRGECEFRFERIVLLRRDPRDELISRTLYYVYPWLERNGHDPDKVASWISALKRKEISPASVAFHDVMADMERIFLHNPLSGMEPWLSAYRDFLKAFAEDVFVLPYEAFVSGDKTALEHYLRLKIPQQVSLGRLERTRRSASYNNWKELFIPVDVERVRAVMGESIADYGYSDWTTQQPERLDEALYSGYVTRLVGEYLQRRRPEAGAPPVGATVARPTGAAAPGSGKIARRSQR